VSTFFDIYKRQKSTGTKKAPSHEATLFCTLPWKTWTSVYFSKFTFKRSM